MAAITENSTLLPSASLRYPSKAGYTRHEVEDLTSESEEEYSDMAELSDSPSSHISSSRPTTPSAHHSNPSDSPMTSPPRHRARTSASPPIESGPICLAQKAERILGLIPGTLPYAQACLSYAKEEIRRTADESQISFNSTFENTGIRSRFDRARKVMSVTLAKNTPIPGVIVGAGGEEEEMRRERRRRATDGVIYWQREIQRLEREEDVERKPSRGRGKR